MPKIFISYRQDDSKWPADRICQIIRSRLPRTDVFIDVDDIPLGVDFAEHIDARVAQCDVMLVLIGPDWLGASSGNNRRIDHVDDFVRREVSSAIKQGVRVVPVLLDGASMPMDLELPDEIKALSRRNGIEIRRRSFDPDLERLLTGIGVPPAPPTPKPNNQIVNWLIALGLLVGVAAAAIDAMSLIDRSPKADEAEKAPPAN